MIYSVGARQRFVMLLGCYTGGMKTFALRLRPHQDLYEELAAFTREKGLQAGVILTGVGSLERVELRLAHHPQTTVWQQDYYEIVSLTGTLSHDGLHLHMAVADGTGQTIGGHVKKGNRVNTTAEIVIGELREVKFARVMDEETGYGELVVEQKEK